MNGSPLCEAGSISIVLSGDCSQGRLDLTAAELWSGAVASEGVLVEYDKRSWTVSSG